MKYPRPRKERELQAERTLASPSGKSHFGAAFLGMGDGGGAGEREQESRKVLSELDERRHMLLQTRLCNCVDALIAIANWRTILTPRPQYEKMVSKQ